MGGERADRAVEAFPLAAGGVGEDKVKFASIAQDRQRVGAAEVHEFRPPAARRNFCGRRVLFGRDDGDVRPGQQAGGDPGGPNASAGAKLEHASPGGKVSGEGG